NHDPFICGPHMAVKAGFAIEFPFLADGARIHWGRETNPADNSVGIHFVGAATGIFVQRGMWPGRSRLHSNAEPDRWDSDVPAAVRSRQSLSSCPRIDEEQRLNRPVWATGSLGSQTQIFEIPVDSQTQRMTLAFSFDAEGSNVTIVAPSRGTITQNSSD